MRMARQHPRALQLHRASGDPLARSEARDSDGRARAERTNSLAKGWPSDAGGTRAGFHSGRPRENELADRRSARCRGPPRNEADDAAVVDQEARDQQARLATRVSHPTSWLTVLFSARRRSAHGRTTA